MDKQSIKILSAILFLNITFPAITYAEWEASSFLPETTAQMDLTSPETTPHLNLTLDRTFSPIVGADLMIFALRGYEALDDCLIPSTEGDTRLSMILARYGKFLFETVLSSTLMVTQHEVFGHGARAREFHLPVLSYFISPFSGSTSFSAIRYYELSLNEQSALSAGGMEGTTILANRLRERWLQGNRIDSREASLYLLSYLDQTLYILSTPRETRHLPASSGHDIGDYIHEVNTWYGKKALTVEKLRDQALIDFLDPFFYYSVYSLGSYLITGSQTLCDYPMIQIGDYRYLPGARLALAPYGPEYQFLNYIQTPERFIKATIRYGNTKGISSAAVDLDITRIWTSDLLFLDTKVSLWNQPKLFKPEAKPHNTRLGFAASLIARYQVIDKIEMMGQLGYKTTGFLQGEILRNGLIARIGLIMQL